MGIVYLLRADNGDCDLHKIGITKYSNADKRLKSLKTGNGNEITVIETFQSKFNNKIERALHNRYVNKRAKGEWFELTNEEVKSFVVDCQKLHDNFQLLVKSGNPFI